ncbi:hypothetical protein BDV98DRAFT_295713 [Pterulicium gracile]|uniref:Uncharacterized protein n=1 Tax=Pterulicium gracile TaxID=1884261 RepID=A0A5C3QTQ0_9AGAR|nr:hypothetical protein BDV98DRAFT_295713 [Pterula gracilis]
MRPNAGITAASFSGRCAPVHVTLAGVYVCLAVFCRTPFEVITISQSTAEALVVWESFSRRCLPHRNACAATTRAPHTQGIDINSTYCNYTQKHDGLFL